MLRGAIRNLLLNVMDPMSLVKDALVSDARLETILALMERGDFVIDFQDPRTGATPLLLAIYKRREDVAVELIMRGANVEITELHGHTPLTRACFGNLQATAHALIQAGADMERAQGFNWTPLGHAALGGHISMVRAMLSWGADPNGVGTRQQTARMVAKNYGHRGILNFLDTCGSILVVRSAGEVHRLGKNSALKRLPKDLGRMVGALLM
jgi:ankyrin repeat protein